MADSPTVLRVARLLEGLASGVPTRQHDAFLELCELRSDGAVEVVMGRLQGLSRPVRVQVFRYLSRVASPAAQGHLLRHLHSREEGDRAAALEAFDAISVRARTDALLSLLAREDPEDQRYAARELRKARSGHVVLPLCQRFPEVGPAVRVEILQTLEQIADPKSLGFARRALGDPSTEVACQAIQLLRNVEGGGRTEAKALADVLTRPEVEVRRKACWAMARLRTARTEKALAGRLDSDPDRRVRTAAARALGAYPGALSARALVRAASSDPEMEVQHAAVFSLASLPGKGPRRELLAFLEKGSPAERRLAAEQLGFRREGAAVPFLLAWLKDGADTAGQVAATESLRPYREAPVRAALMAALSGRLPVAYAAAQALCWQAGASGLEGLEPVLRSGSGIRVEVLQVFALHLTVVAQVRPLPTSLLEPVRSWLGSSNVQLPYLAIRILEFSGGLPDLGVLQEVLRTSPDPDVRAKTRHVMHRILLRGAPAARQGLGAGALPEGRELWSVLRVLPAPSEGRSAWLQSALARATGPSGAPPRLTGVLSAWGLRWTDCLAGLLEGEGLAPAPAVLALAALARAGRRRPLTPRESACVRTRLADPDPAVRRAAVVAARRTDPLAGMEAMMTLAEQPTDGEERREARHTVRAWMGAGAR